MVKPEVRIGRRTGGKGPRAALLIAGLICVFSPATAVADVIELGPQGEVVVRASDVPGTSAAATGLAAGVQEDVGDLRLPADAMTVVADLSAPEAYSTTVTKTAEAQDISPALLEALVWQESRWHPAALSRAGAIGLAQLMPATARELGVDPRDPHANLAGGARYLRQQLDRFDGNIELALAAYNAGPGRVQRARAVPPIAETQAYVRAIVDRLSATPPAQGNRP